MRHLLSPMLLFYVFCGLCLPPTFQSKAVELSVLDMVCRLSELEAAVQCRTGQLSRRADRLTGVNSTGCGLIQTSHLPQCSKNRWLTLIYLKQPCSRWNTHTQSIRKTHSLRDKDAYTSEHMGIDQLVWMYIHVGTQTEESQIVMSTWKLKEVIMLTCFKLHITYEGLLLCTLALKYNTHSNLSQKKNNNWMLYCLKNKNLYRAQTLKWCLEPIWMQTWSCKVKVCLWGQNSDSDQWHWK